MATYDSFAADLTAALPSPGVGTRVKREGNVPSSSRAPFAILYSPSGVHHNAPNTHDPAQATGEAVYHQECSARLELLCNPSTGVLRSLECDDVKFCEVDRAANIADILRVHEHSYYQHVKKVCEGATPRAQLDMDTKITAKSWNAALEAAGAALHAVDLVAHGHVRSAFVASRPPGHHAGPRGAVPSCGFHAKPDMCSSGFCLFNNIAIAGAYARYAYGNRSIAPFVPRPGTALLERIAIIDFDIHDGNGTASIVHNLKPHKEKLPLPQSWAEREIDSYAPWLSADDADHVLFGSIHLYDGDDFYPGSGSSEESTSNVINVPLDVAITPSQKRALTNRHLRGEPLSKLDVQLMEKGSEQFRKRVAEQLLPKLDAFCPDIIFFSAGFDGHYLDFYHVLSEDDYAWLTTKVRAIAEKHAGGRMISVLEGGYHVERTKPKPRSVRATPARKAKGSAGSSGSGSGGRQRKKTAKMAEYEKARKSSPSSSTSDEVVVDVPTTPSTPPPSSPASNGSFMDTVGGLGTACRAHVEAMI